MGDWTRVSIWVPGDAFDHDGFVSDIEDTVRHGADDGVAMEVLRGQDGPCPAAETVVSGVR